MNFQNQFFSPFLNFGIIFTYSVLPDTDLIEVNSYL